MQYWQLEAIPQVNTIMRIKRLKESKQGRMADALALGGDEGRDKLR